MTMLMQIYVRGDIVLTSGYYLYGASFHKDDWRLWPIQLVYPISCYWRAVTRREYERSCVCVLWISIMPPFKLWIFSEIMVCWIFLFFSFFFLLIFVFLGKGGVLFCFIAKCLICLFSCYLEFMLYCINCLLI